MAARAMNSNLRPTALLQRFGKWVASPWHALSRKASASRSGRQGGGNPSKPVAWQLPWIGNRPFATQVQILGASLTISLVLAAGAAVVDNQFSSRVAAQIELTDDSLMHSQRLAKAVPMALEGIPEGFAQLRDSGERLTSNLNLLLGGGVHHGQPLPAASGELRERLTRLRRQWQRNAAQAQFVIDRNTTLTRIVVLVAQVRQSNPLLWRDTEQVAQQMLEANQSAREIYFAGQLGMLTQRWEKQLVQALLGRSIEPQAIAAMSQDLAAFRELVIALQRGSEPRRILPARDSAVIDQLQALQRRFDSIELLMRNVLAQLPILAAAKQTGRAIFMDNEALRTSLMDLQTAYRQTLDYRRYAVGMVAALVALAVCLTALMAVVFYRESESRAREAVRQREEARRQEEEARRLNDQNQSAILRLMNELQEVADGDLTVQATVSEDITGAIADSVNYTVDELRGLVSRINSAAEQVSQATRLAEQISTRLMTAATQQSREITETGESVLRLTAQINEVSAGANESAGVARASLSAAEEGQRAVENAISGMNDIRDQIQETSKRIKRLGESSQEIGEIIELINDLTEQTNVLAWNAAIQAASAGEAGRGFTVVAEEVQRLADRSAQATQQIGALVHTIQTDTQDAVAAMERSTQGVVEGAKLSDAAGQALGNIGRVSRQLSELIENISSTTSRQSESANRVARSIEHILTVTEETSTGTRQTGDAIRDLASLAQTLKSSVSRFRVE